MSNHPAARSFDMHDSPTTDEPAADPRSTMPFAKIDTARGPAAPAPTFGRPPEAQPTLRNPHQSPHMKTVIVPPGAIPAMGATPFVPVQAAQAMPPPRHDAHAAYGGIAMASDAAASPPPRPVEPARPLAPRHTPAGDYLDLLWFDERAALRLRTKRAWSQHLREPATTNEWLGADEVPESREQVRPEKDVRRALSRVGPVPQSELPLLLAEAVDDDGLLDRPLCVVSGELMLGLDPLAALRAALGAAGHFAAADKKLKEVIDATAEVAAGEGPIPAALLEALAARLRQAFASTMRGVPHDALDVTVERSLLSGRKYLKRSVLGGAHIVAELHGDGAPATVYLPDAISELLPLFRRFPVRLLAEPHAPQDPTEQAPVALKALALCRVVSPRRT